MNRFRQILQNQTEIQTTPAPVVTSNAPEPPRTVVDVVPDHASRHHPYDPRPDLDDPGRLWATVLATAHAIYGVSEIYTFFQGLRILECRLFLKPDGKLHLDTKPAIESGWNEALLRQEWLLPQKQLIVDVFGRAEAVLAGLPPGSRLPAWMRRTG